MNLREQDLFFWFSSFQGNRTVSELFDTLYKEKENNSWQNFVEQCLADQHPVLVHIDPKVLPYIKYNTPDPSIGHYINIIGIDPKEKKLCVSDSYVPTYSPSTYTGWIDCSAVTDSHIDACWRINLVALYHFFQGHKEEDILDFTNANIIRRLTEFLWPDESNHRPAGITELRKLPDTIYHHIQNKNYDDMFKLLAGIRLHIINPLVYLRLSLERNQSQYQDLIKSLGAFIVKYWETPNMQLIKFSIAHKSLDSECIATQIKAAVFTEQAVLTTILENLMITKKSYGRKK